MPRLPVIMVICYQHFIRRRHHYIILSCCSWLLSCIEHTAVYHGDNNGISLLFVGHAACFTETKIRRKVQVVAGATGGCCRYTPHLPYCYRLASRHITYALLYSGRRVNGEWTTARYGAAVFAVVWYFCRHYV